MSQGINELNWVFSTGCELAVPPAVVWPVFRDVRRWYPEYSWEVVDGPPYDGGLREGQALELRSTHELPQLPGGPQRDFPDVYAQKNLKVTPEQEIIILLSGSVYDLRQYTAFYVWKLSAHRSGTLVSIDTYGHGELTRPLLADELEAYEREFDRNWYRSWSVALGNLRGILDKQRDEQR